MIRHLLPSASLATAILTLLLTACASQIGQDQPPPKREEPVARPQVPNNRDQLVLSNQLGPIDEHQDGGEEIPSITSENSVFFTIGSSALGSNEKRKLENIAERLVADKTLHVSLAGYANDNGSTSFNLAVSDNRVAVVAAFLRKRGVHGEQISVRALGSEKNPSDCRSSKCKQAFRRVDLTIYKNK